MDLALGVSVGSSMQIALLVTPIMVIIGWGMNVDMSLFFNMYETAVLFASVVMVNYLIMVTIKKIGLKKSLNDTYRVEKVTGSVDLCFVRFMLLSHSVFFIIRMQQQVD